MCVPQASAAYSSGVLHFLVFGQHSFFLPPNSTPRHESLSSGSHSACTRKKNKRVTGAK